jgi:menaquinone-dependent protoporphyrinogen oxidase
VFVPFMPGAQAVQILVAYASRHGSTQGIAARIAERLRADGLDVALLAAAEVPDPSRYDAFVVGGAAYMFHWLKDATSFVRKNRTLLAARPTWLFSSGPIGTATVDEEGRDVLETTVPKEFAGSATRSTLGGRRCSSAPWTPRRSRSA